MPTGDSNGGGKLKLTPQQRQAADQLGQGHQQREIAKALDVDARTLRRWSESEDFQALIRQSRQRLLDEHPTAESVLQSALHATRRNGDPDWGVRIAAARALLLPTAQPENDASRTGIRETKVYLAPAEDEPDDTPPEESEEPEDNGGARPDARTSPFPPEEGPQTSPEGPQNLQGRSERPSEAENDAGPVKAPATRV